MSEMDELAKAVERRSNQPPTYILRVIVETSPTCAATTALASLVVPGLGVICLGRPILGVLLFLLSVIGYGLSGLFGLASVVNAIQPTPNSIDPLVPLAIAGFGFIFHALSVLVCACSYAPPRDR